MAILKTIDHDGIEHAGYLAFLSLFSLFPALFFITAMTGYIAQVLDKYDLMDSIKTLFVNNTSEEILAGLVPRINEIISGPPPALLKLAIFGAVWTASSTVEGLRTVLNKVYYVESKHSYILRRLLSMIQFLVIAFIMIVAMLVLTITPAIENLVTDVIHIKPQWLYLRYLGSTLILFFSISWLYIMLPNVKQKWSHVMPGALITVILWTITAVFFSSYINDFHQVNVIYGSLGGIIIALLFFYVINICFIYGAAFNYQLRINFHLLGS